VWEPVVAVEGGLGDVSEHFLAEGWSDGLPLVPPTRERVDAFAVNGVMAGCRPEYMPVLVALVEVMCDPMFRLHDAGATPGWEPVAVVSGPIVDELDFNHEAGVMRVGRQANTTVGRFVRLFMRTVAGFRITPDETDKGSIGFPFNVALAESPATTDRLAWPSYGQDSGFAAGSDVVSLQSVVLSSGPMYTAGPDPRRHLDAIGTALGNMSRSWCVLGLARQSSHLLVVMSPIVADLLARHGLTKQDISEHIHTVARISPWELERCLWWHYGHRDFGDIVDQHHIANLSKYMPELAEILPHESIDGDSRFAWSRDETVPIFPHPESIRVVVAGDPGRNQTKGYLNNHLQGPNIARPIVRPARWAELRSRVS